MIAARNVRPLIAIAMASATPAAVAGSGNAWSSMTQRDVTFVHDAIVKTDIYSITGDAAFATTLAAATRDAMQAAPSATSLKGYQAVLKRYLGALQDPHARVSFNAAPTTVDWASFLVRLRGDRYYVVGSQDARVIDGAEVTSCDGDTLDRIADGRAPLEQSVPGLQSVRAQMARGLTVDAGNPFYKRLTSCVIGGVPVTLKWQPISQDALSVANARFAPFKDQTVWLKSVGDDGSWVRLGIFYPPSQEVADQYHALYAQLPAIRNKRFIVIDVRGNGGGSYNWFMGFLRALYGDEYSAYYARARLKIRPAYADHPTKPDPQPSGAPPDIVEPIDAPLVDAQSHAVRVRLPNGRFVYRTPPIAGAQDPTTAPPVSPVHAQVLVLTDNGCGSACIAFVDEMRRFPGVTQIGADTFVDRLSGTATSLALPSGNGNLLVPTMIRYGRERGDNEPRVPAIRYDGDLTDTAAVQAWIVNTVVKAADRTGPAAPGGQ